MRVLNNLELDERTMGIYFYNSTAYLYITQLTGMLFSETVTSLGEPMAKFENGKWWIKSPSTGKYIPSNTEHIINKLNGKRVYIQSSN